ncbi:hypothetical protein [Solimonas soli]|uniref:hypothetical protein n=1 Tax=Solimonas soli TaxID=413479 RepID=UPI0012F80AED|nr:hypothetical protein [Solimonas soli]
MQHHRAFAGGLLVHGAGLLDPAGPAGEEAARSMVPGDARSPHLAQLGYRLHDLGKL